VQYSIKNLALFASLPAHKIDTNYRHQHNKNEHKLSKEFVNGKEITCSQVSLKDVRAKET
jgi:hypothetical protein